MIFLASRLQEYFEIKSAVEAKWDVIAMLCLLLFFLSVVILVYTIMRPSGIVRKVIALCIAFPLGYGVAFIYVHQGLSPEFYRMACEDMMGRLDMSDEQASKQCKTKNPIKLSRVKRDWSL